MQTNDLGLGGASIVTSLPQAPLVPEKNSFVWSSHLHGSPKALLYSWGHSTTGNLVGAYDLFQFAHQQIPLKYVFKVDSESQDHSRKLRQVKSMRSGPGTTQH